MGLSPFCGFAYDVCFAYRGVGWIRAGGCFWGLGLAPYFQSVVLNRRNAQADALLHLTVSPGARLCGGSSHLHSVAALHP